jgi:hypothetical protein
MQMILRSLVWPIVWQRRHQQESSSQRIRVRNAETGM